MTEKEKAPAAVGAAVEAVDEQTTLGSSVSPSSL